MRAAQIQLDPSKGGIASATWVKQATAKVDALLKAIDENELSASAEWEKEKELASIMCIGDHTQWLYAMEGAVSPKEKGH